MESNIEKSKIWIETPEEIKQLLDNPISEEQIRKFKCLLGFNDNTLAKEGCHPKCILIIGARAAGKTTITNKLKNYLPNINLKEFGIFDGDILRSNYKPFVEISSHPNVRYINAWDILKPHMDTARFNILYNHIIPEKRNFILAAGENCQFYYNLLKSNGYDIIIVGISVSDWNEILYRGNVRAENTGRPYSGTKDMWEQCQKSIEELSNKEDSVVIDNSNFEDPKIIFIHSLSR